MDELLDSIIADLPSFLFLAILLFLVIFCLFVSPIINRQKEIRLLKSEIITLRSEMQSLRFSSEATFRKRLSTFISQVCSRSYLKDTPAFRSVIQDSSPEHTRRLMSALSAGTTLASPYALQVVAQGKDGREYTTTLHSCTCPDFQNRHIVCKHMLFLAIESGVLSCVNYTAQLEKLKALASAQQEQHEFLALYEKRRSDLNHIVSEKSQRFPWLSQQFAEFQYAQDMGVADSLLQKHPPAKRAAEQVSQYAKKNKALLTENKSLKYQLDFLTSVFPWLPDFMEVPPTVAYQREVSSTISADAQEDYHAVSDWISKDEYDRLPDSKKYQLALDRYLKKHKGSWEIGIEYERYIGYLCEQQGYKVQYIGATKKLEDMGRDLLLEKGNKIIAIQCKRWATRKEIHENHVFQLCGSVFHLQSEHPKKEVIGVFVTSTTFSDVATLCAEKLGIRLYPNIPFHSFPVIKCNIGKTGQKIFHLPMDLQYDIVQINQPGEFFAATVDEAISAGFRRAYRWKGSKK